MTPTTTAAAEAEEKRRWNAWDATLKRVSRAWGAHRSPNNLKGPLPVLYANLEAAEKRLNDSWLSARLGLITPAEFDAALKAWEEASYAAITALKAVKP